LSIRFHPILDRRRLVRPFRIQEGRIPERTAEFVTPLPLILFVAGAQRTKLSTIGFLQYIAPTGQFLLAVFLYDEPFTRDSLVTFALIWRPDLAGPRPLHLRQPPPRTARLGPVRLFRDPRPWYYLQVTV
jgi:hypothetical protein